MPPIDDTKLVHREYSTIERQMVAGRPVYVKKHLASASWQTPSLVRDQVARDVEIVKRLASLSRSTMRLGVMKIVEHDFNNAQVTIEEVPGEPLYDVLRYADRQTLNVSCVRALHLAGKWSRFFQSLPIDDGLVHSTPNNPEDLVEHCELRLQRLSELGYPWPNAAIRARMLGWLRRQVDATPKEHLKRVWSHGDFGPFNMIWDHRTLTPIDFASSATDLPLVDVTYLIHRLEMLPIEFPWRTWPVALWRKACLRGYGMPEADELPIYRALMVRRLLSHLKKLVERKPTTTARTWHTRWCRRWIRVKFVRLIQGQTG